MHIDTVNTIDEFQKLQDNWNSVYAADTESQFFLSWIWLTQLFARRPEEWAVLAAKADESDDKYVAFFPLRPRKRFSKSQQKEVFEIYMGGNFWADFTGYICHPDYATAAVKAFALHVRDLNWTKLHLENIRSSPERLQAFLTPFSKPDFRTTRRNRTSKVDGIDNLICPTLFLPSQFDRYLQTSVSTNTRQKIRRYSRRLESDPDLEIKESSKSTRTRDLDAFVSFWQSRWAQRKGQKVEILAKKYRKILQQGLEAEILYMPVLLSHGKPVAVHASFIDTNKRSLLFFVAGRNMEWTTLPAGLILHAYTIRWAISQKIQTYELLRGNEKYKYSLGAKDSFVQCIRIERR